jgi:hypothetical protein
MVNADVMPSVQRTLGGLVSCRNRFDEVFVGAPVVRMHGAASKSLRGHFPLTPPYARRPVRQLMKRELIPLKGENINAPACTVEAEGLIGTHQTASAKGGGPPAPFAARPHRRAKSSVMKDDSGKNVTPPKCPVCGNTMNFVTLTPRVTEPGSVANVRLRGL